MPNKYKTQCPICDRKDVLNIVHHLKTIHSVNADDWLFKAKLLCLIIVYSNKKETSDFHGTVSFDPVKMSQQK